MKVLVRICDTNISVEEIAKLDNCIDLRIAKQGQKIGINPFISLLLPLFAIGMLGYLFLNQTPVSAQGKAEKPQITKIIIEEQQGYYNVVKWGRYNQPVQVFDTRVNEMINRGYSLTRVIDLTTLLTMECPRYDGKCINTSDIGPFQINRIVHRGIYLRSKELFYNSKALFKYQLTYANDTIVQDLVDRFCGWQYAITNEIRFKCIARNYNGNTHIYSNGKQGRDNYKVLAREKRKQVARYIVDNYPLLKN